jgi:hypothetical protein
MVKLVDTLDLGPSDFGLVGSSPTACIKSMYINLNFYFSFFFSISIKFSIR